MIARRERMSLLSVSRRVGTTAQVGSAPHLSRHSLMVHDLCGVLVIVVSLAAYLILA